MPNFESTKLLESTTHPGVRFRVRCLTEGYRLALRRHLAAALARIHDLDAEREDWVAEIAAERGTPPDQLQLGELTARQRRKWGAYAEQIDLIYDTEVNPAYLEAGLAEIEGIEIDGIALKSAAIRAADLPAGLAAEILKAVLREAGLAAGQIENLRSPTTSGAEVDGPTSGTGAPSVSASDSTSSATAVSISPAA